MMAVFDDRRCELGEGPLWHPGRNQLFWFDILGKRLLTRTDGGTQDWAFPELVSAAGWVDDRSLLIASESALFRFDLDSGARSDLCALEADRPDTRSNDGRADPQGGFWIGTMGKRAEPGAGAVYRWFRGELRRLFSGISIPNSICFTPDGRTAHFSDSARRQVMRVALDGDGWPVGTPEVFLDLTGGAAEPDGAVVDASGLFWLAEWNGSGVSAFAPDGSHVRHVPVAAAQSSCPAFGGADLSTLFVTSALQGLDAAARLAEPQGGMTFAIPGVAKGQSEHRVIL
jgi:sugar lactone lactonase YvrE